MYSRNFKRWSQNIQAEDQDIFRKLFMERLWKDCDYDSLYNDPQNAAKGQIGERREFGPTREVALSLLPFPHLSMRV